MISMPDKMISRYQENLETIIKAYIKATHLEYEHINAVFNVVLNHMKETE